MSKQKSKPLPLGRVVRLIILPGLLISTLVGASSYGYYCLREHVERDLSFSQRPPIVVLRNRPAWMSDALAERIASFGRPVGTRSALDHQLLVDVADTLQQNAWVRQVKQVRRTFTKSPGDTIEIDCEYREPMALAAYKNEYILIDSQGYKLPERFSAKMTPTIMFDGGGGVNLRIIDGMAAMPPFLDGQQWAGQDLQAGLDLVKLLYSKSYADEIQRVDVSNFGHRRSRTEGQLVLITKYNTQIVWGAPVRGLNFELPPGKKLECLEMLYQTYTRGKERRIDGNLLGPGDRLSIMSDKPAILHGEAVVHAGGRGARSRAN